MTIDDRVFDIDFYKQCEEKVASVFSRESAVVGIYKFGYVGAPGCSDIDLLFVVNEEEGIGNKILKIMATNFSESEKYHLLMHSPMVLNEFLAERVNFIRPASDLQHVSGRKISIKDNITKEVHAIQLAELLVQYYPMALIKTPRSSRWCLALINAYKHIIEIARNIGYKLSDEELEAGLASNDGFRQSFQLVDDAAIANHFGRVSAVIIRHSYELKDWLLQSLMSEYESWPNSSKNRVIGRNYFCADKDTKGLLRFFLRRDRLFFQPSGLESLFFDVHELPDPIRQIATMRKELINTYSEFLYGRANGVGLYFPWTAVPETAKRRFLAFVLNVFA